MVGIVLGITVDRFTGYSGQISHQLHIMEQADHISNQPTRGVADAFSADTDLTITNTSPLTITPSTPSHTSPLLAQELRVALVIGNSDYQIAPLASPVADAKAMQKILQQLGFHVMSLTDASAVEMHTALLEFGNTLQDVGGVGLFYYAGHGVQVDGENYLIPVGANIRREYEVKYQSLNINQVLDEMGRARNRINIVVLDTCRDNPFVRSTRSLENGLAPINPGNTPSGTIIAYATAAGATAVDGDDNGLFTKHLLTHIRTPNLPIEQVFKRARVDVMQASQGEQVPWEHSSLTGDFYFNSAAISIKEPLVTTLPSQSREG